MYDVWLLGENPVTKGPRKKRPAKARKKGQRTMAKKGKKRGKHNPLGNITGSAKSALKHGIALGVGAVVTRAVVNNLPLPASLQDGLGAFGAHVAVGVGLGYLAKKVKPIAAYSESLRDGGVALAVYKIAAPKALPLLAFTADAKAKASIDQQAYALLAASKAQQASTDAQGQASGTSGVGDAFVMSRGGITTADRSPRDTAALAGVGEAYAKERPGFAGGAPNRLRAPWGRSVFAKN